MFVFLALLSVVALAFVRKFPRHYEVQPREAQGSVPGKSVPNVLALAAVILATFGQILFFTYLSSIGTAAGLPEDVAAAGLAVSGIFAFLGAVFSIVLGRRLSGVIPITLIAMLGISGVAAANSNVAWQYTVAISAFYCAIPLYAVAQFGFLMRRASSQSFAVNIAAAQFTGTAIAPATGGLIITQYGYGGLQLLSIGAALTAYLLLWIYGLAPQGGAERPIEEQASSHGHADDGLRHPLPSSA